MAVILSGTSRGATTDANGYYVIEVPKIGAILEFSSLGYKSQKVAVPKSLALDVFLQDDALEMEAAVVVGMGHQRKASVIGAISSVAKDNLQIPQRNLTNALAGKVAGAVVVQRTGEPGMDNADFWIRGISAGAGRRRGTFHVRPLHRGNRKYLNSEGCIRNSRLRSASRKWSRSGNYPPRYCTKACYRCQN